MPITRIDKICIHKFRLFEDVEFQLGSTITVIAGHNATGKSTLLSLLGHCAELKGANNKPLIHRNFGTEFSEIIKGSLEFDKRISSAYTLYFSGNDEVKSISLRTGWQKYKEGKRFRIIPKKTAERKTERKLEWPTLYLGLSRLYPVGESEQAKKISVHLTDEQEKELYSAHRSILSLYEEPRDYTGITLREKKTVGIVTNTYDYICNSAGQDNLSQIIMAVLSFEALKAKLGSEWKGGLLLIDELDAALHPAAQELLVKYLYRTAKKLEIQVVFTTHSLSLLESICRITSSNTVDSTNCYEHIYITTRNNTLEIERNPDYSLIYYDMLNLSSSHSVLRKITVYSEDDEARWFLTKMIAPVLNRVDTPNIKMGYTDLLKLYKCDPKHFRNIIFVLDGDVMQSEVDDTVKSLPYRDVKNIIKLPAEGLSPEELFFNFLKKVLGSSAYKEIRNEICAADSTLSYRIMIEVNGPASFTRYADDRKKFKAWFNTFKHVMDVTYRQWELLNIGAVNAFREEFVEAYNDCAKRMRLPNIQIPPIE